MISFVLGARNDGYGGECPGVKNFAMRRLQLTIASILALPVDAEIVIVEWCPPADRPGVAGFMPDGPVRVVTVPAEANELLHAADPAGRRLPFYEYIAKHVGIEFARSDRIVAANGDNVFPSTGFDRAMAAITDVQVVRAFRHEIEREHAALPFSELIARGDAGRFDVLRTFDGAGGDFCAVTRGTYARLGGYLLVHGNRGVDREFTERARTHGVAVIQEYEHYHVTHDNAIVEAPGRSLDVIEAAPVEPELVDEVWRLVDGANGD